jgi:hypothetical protein
VGAALVILIAALGATGPDSDGDGIPDSEEDPNGNGIVDPGESDPREVDTDHDNVPDDVERRMGSDPNDGADVPPIPEPLLVDLVRNLGSRRGEMEVNVLTSTSFRRSPAIQWGPEIEYAPVRGLGFELEAPFADGALQAVKLGGQATVASFGARRVELGVLGSYAYRTGERGADAALGLVTGIRFGARVQGMLIAGPLASRVDGRAHLGASANPSLFYQLSRSWTVGLELGHRFEPERRSYALPQVHLNPLDAFKIQIGCGAELVESSVAGLVAMRVAVER